MYPASSSPHRWGAIPHQRHELHADPAEPLLAAAPAAAGAAGTSPRSRRVPAAPALCAVHTREAGPLPARRARLPGDGSAARLRLLPDLRSWAGPAVRGLHDPLSPRSPLPRPFGGDPAPLCPHPGPRKVPARQWSWRDALSWAGRIYRAWGLTFRKLWNYTGPDAELSIDVSHKPGQIHSLEFLHCIWKHESKENIWTQEMERTGTLSEGAL